MRPVTTDKSTSSVDPNDNVDASTGKEGNNIPFSFLRIIKFHYIKNNSPFQIK